MRVSRSDPRVAIAAALAVYLAWTTATYLLEGRPRTLLRPEATVPRATYALVANVGVALGVGGVTLVALARTGGSVVRAAGFDVSLAGSAAAVAAGALVGALAYVAQSPGGRPAALVANAFAQALPTSAAEVLVCWSLGAAAIACGFRRLSSRAARAAAVVPGSVLFGVYHVAHSPPFDTPAMIAFLAAVGLVTGGFFAVSGDVYAAIALHNALAVIGVVEALERVGAVPAYRTVQPSVVLLALLAIVATLTVGAVLRRGTGRYAGARGPDGR